MSILLKDKQYLIEPLFEIKEYTNVLENIKRGIPTTVTAPSESQKVI